MSACRVKPARCCSSRDRESYSAIFCLSFIQRESISDQRPQRLSTIKTARITQTFLSTIYNFGFNIIFGLRMEMKTFNVTNQNKTIRHHIDGCLGVVEWLIWLLRRKDQPSFVRSVGRPRSKRRLPSANFNLPLKQTSFIPTTGNQSYIVGLFIRDYPIQHLTSYS